MEYCDYCTPAPGHDQLALVDDPLVLIQIEKETPIQKRKKMYRHLQISAWNEDFQCEIKYCPMCGRKL